MVSVMAPEAAAAQPAALRLALACPLDSMVRRPALAGVFHRRASLAPMGTTARRCAVTERHLPRAGKPGMMTP